MLLRKANAGELLKHTLDRCAPSHSSAYCIAQMKELYCFGCKMYQRRRFFAVDGVAQWACHAATHLAEDDLMRSSLGSSSSTIVPNLVQARTAPTPALQAQHIPIARHSMLQVLSRHVDDADVVEECLACLATLAQTDANKRVMIAAGTNRIACEFILLAVVIGVQIQE